MMITLRSENATIVVDPKAGGRVISLCVYGLELLKQATAVDGQVDPMAWGCFPMVPWAGRIRNAQFTFEGKTWHLPESMPPHAIHGTTYLLDWQQDNESQISVSLGKDWPFSGRAIQHFKLDDEKLTLRLEVHTQDKPFPCSIGWHPWFNRQLAKGQPLELLFDAEAMYVKDEAGIPTGDTCAQPKGPWDDCFTGLRQTPKLMWPGALQVELRSTVDHWVVFNEREEALCVEPQTAPPNALNLSPYIVTTNTPLIAEYVFSWQKL